MKKIFFATIILILPSLVFAQDADKRKAYYFYGEQCPHCQNVDEYFKSNGVYDKYDITKLEFSNPFNARLLMKFGEAFKSEYKGSVPAIAFGDKFLVGDQPIIDDFEKEISSVEAKELPDPDKIGNTEEKGNQGDQGNRGSRKNQYIIFGGMILLGGILGFRYFSKKT